MIEFLVMLKNEKARQYDRLALFMILLNIGILSLFGFYSIKNTDRIVAFAGAGLALIALVAGYLMKKADKPVNRLKQISILPILLAWIFLGIWWGYGLFILVMLLHQVSQRKLVVEIAKDAIRYPSFPKRTINWNELNNLVLKDGLLTIDFKNNKILQSEIIHSSTEPNEKEFNDFCRAQLH